jgi:hypothetical protein
MDWVGAGASLSLGFGLVFILCFLEICMTDTINSMPTSQTAAGDVLDVWFSILDHPSKLKLINE